MKMKGKRGIAGILLAGMLAAALAGCGRTQSSGTEGERPVITLGSDSYPPYNYLNEDGVPTGIDVELATEAAWQCPDFAGRGHKGSDRPKRRSRESAAARGPQRPPDGF